MKIQMLEGKVETVTFYRKPEGTLYPIDQLPKDKKQLSGFLWDPENRPNPVAFEPYFAAHIPVLPYAAKQTKSKKKEGKR